MLCAVVSKANRGCLAALVGVILLAVSGSDALGAELIHVSQAGGGAQDGASAANARSLAWLNNAANWGNGAAKVSPGDTVLLSGLFSSRLVIAGSGAPTQPVTIRFDAGARFAAPYWGTDTDAAIFASGKSHLTIDGDSVGVIENTANGTALAHQQLSAGIVLTGGTDITIQRLTIRNLYVRTADSNDPTGSAGLSIRGVSTSGVSNLTVDGCTINYCKYGVIVDADGANGIAIRHNAISRCSTMVVIAKGGATPTAGVTVSGNTFANGNYWDFTAGDIFHGDGLHMWTGSGAFSDVTIDRNNMLTDWGVHSTGAIFLEGRYGTLRIYSNLVGTTAERLAEAAIDLSALVAETSVDIFGNTLVGAAPNNTGGIGLFLQGANWKASVRNNIFYNFYSAVTLSTAQPLANLDFDYNCYYSLSNISTRINPATGDQSGSSGTLAAWIAYLGGGGDETHGITSNPLFVGGGSYALQSASPCRDAGGALGSPYDVDLLFVSRVGTPDLGALEFQPAVVPQLARLVNISTRAAVATGADVVIGGFVISGTTPKQVLIRGVGPTLDDFGVPTPLADPMVTLFDGNEAIVATNNDWAGASAIASAAAAVQAFALPAASKDAALLLTLNAGSYTVHLASSSSATTGIALLEIYETGPGARLANISTRGRVGIGDSILIAGFVVQGTSPRQLLIRGVGPTLGAFGVPETLADPRVELLDQARVVIASNDNWGGGTSLALAATQTGAFDLPGDSRDAALLVTLAPGLYTAQVSGVGQTSGIALVEVYEVP